MDYVTGSIGKALYETFGRIIILLLDWLQDIFRGLAGLEGMKINGTPVNGGDEKYDLVFWLVQTDIIQDIFWSMILFSAFLLIIMTVLALVKNTYEEKQKPVWDIISLSFKGLFGFIIVPAMILVGLAFSNILLQAIDAGTSFGNSTKMSTTLFMSSAYDANKVRIAVNDQSTGECREAFVYIVEKTNLLDVDKSLQSAYNALGTLTLEDYDEIATKIDNAFTSGKLVGNLGFVLSAQTASEVAVIYNVWKMNYLILIAGGCVLIGIFFKMCWGMVGRMFKVCFDFVLIPVACAMTPFDSGKANKSIQGDMVKNVTMAYGTVGALNLYFSILPIVNTIEFNNGGLQSTGFMAAIFQLMLSIVGLFSCNAIIKTVNGWFGTGDVLAEGDSTLKAFQSGMKSMKSGFGVGEKVKKASKFVGNQRGAYLGGKAAAEKAGKGKAGQFWGGLSSAFKTTSAGKYMDEASLFKNIAAGKKAGKEAYANIQQSKGLGKDSWHTNTDYNDAAKAEYELRQAKGLLEKKYGSDEAKLATLTPGTKEYSDLKKKLDKKKANDPIIQQLKKGYESASLTYTDADGTVHAGEQKTMLDWDEYVAEREEDLGKAEQSQQAVSGFASALTSETTARDMLGYGAFGTTQQENYAKYLRGEETNPNTVISGIKDNELEILNGARDNYRTMMSESLNGIVAIYKSNSTTLDGKTFTHGGVSKTISESYIKGITDPQEATECLYEMKKYITDFNRISAQLAAKNKQESDRIKDLKANINAAEAQILDNVKSDPAAYAASYSKGAK